MGTKIIYQVPQHIVKQLQQMKKQLQSFKDPVRHKQIRAKMKTQLIKSLQKQKFSNKYENKRVVFLGRTSVGKTSLINKLFDTNEKVRAGKCTIEIKLVKNVKGTQIYDVPGMDSKFDLMNDYQLIINKLGQINSAYILYESVDDVEDIVRILIAMKKSIYGVRTKCDDCDQDCQIKIDQQLQQDRSQFKKIGIPNPVIFASSKKGGFDNQKLMLHVIQ